MDAFLKEEVFFALSFSIRPKLAYISLSVGVERFCHIGLHGIKVCSSIDIVYKNIHPVLIKLAPGRRMTRKRARRLSFQGAPRPTRHEAPDTVTARGISDVVKVWPAEEKVSEFMTADATLCIFRDGQECTHFGL